MQQEQRHLTFESQPVRYTIPHHKLHLIHTPTPTTSSRELPSPERLFGQMRFTASKIPSLFPSVTPLITVEEGTIEEKTIVNCSDDNLLYMASCEAGNVLVMIYRTEMIIYKSLIEDARFQFPRSLSAACAVICGEEVWICWKEVTSRAKTELFTFNLKDQKLRKPDFAGSSPSLLHMCATWIPQSNPTNTSGYLVIAGQSALTSIMSTKRNVFEIWMLNLDTLTSTSVIPKLNKGAQSQHKLMYYSRLTQRLVMIDGNSKHECKIFTGNEYLESVERISLAGDTNFKLICNTTDYDDDTTFSLHRYIIHEKCPKLNIQEDHYDVISRASNSVMEKLVRFIYSGAVPEMDSLEEAHQFIALLKELELQIPDNPVALARSMLVKIWEKRESTSDYMLYCGTPDEDQQILHVHRAIIFMCDYFNAMMNFESQESSLVLDLHPVEAMQRVIRYLYTSDIELTMENSMTVYFIAQEFMIPGLLDLVRPFMIGNLTLENVPVVLSFMEITEDETVEKTLINFFVKGGFLLWMQFKLFEEFPALELKHQTLLDKIEAAVDYPSWERKQKSKNPLNN